MVSTVQEPIRVAYLVPDVSISLSAPGGPTAHIEGTIRGLRSQGLHPRLFVASDYAQGSTKLNEGNLRTPRHTRKKAGPVRAAVQELRRRSQLRHLPKELVSDLEAFNPHAIYERSSIFSSAGLALSKRLKCAHLLETSCCEAEVFSETYGLFSVSACNWLEARKLHKADAVITQSRASVSFARAKFRLPQSMPVIAKPVACELSASTTLGEMPPSVAEFAVCFDLCVIFSGTFGSYQGPNFLMDVIKKANGSCPRVGFVLCGAGGSQKVCEDFAKKFNLNNVLFTGMLKEIDLNLAQSVADIAIVPDCVPYMSPIKTLHYGLSGVPVLVPNYEAFDGLIENGVDGLKFVPGDADSVIQILLEYSEKRGRLTEMGIAFRTKVACEFNTHESVRHVANFLREKYKFK